MKHGLEDRQPVVSVVIPIYNRVRCIGPLAETLKAQSLADWEAIFVDDGSTQDIAGAVEPFLNDPRFRVVRLPSNAGVSAARNAGIDHARGRYVAFLDSDDLWLPAKLERQVEALDHRDEECFCVTLTNVIMPGGWVRVRPDFGPKHGQSFAAFLYRDGGFAQASSLLVPRSLADRVRFREQLRQYEDHLYFIELAATGAGYIVVPDALSTWNNDERPDRLSSVDSVERGMKFLAIAGPLLSCRERLAFRLRTHGEVLFRIAPLRALALAAGALVTGAVRPHKLLALLGRWIVPASSWQALRRVLAR